MAENEKSETNRDRVRRLLITPLVSDGMRFRHGTDPDQQKRMLNRICDDLAYASDETLAGVRVWAAKNAEGSARCFWPPVIGFLATAEAYEPRAIEDVPILRSWFGSRAGPAARDAGRLAAEFAWIQRHKVPPSSDRAKRLISAKAAEWARAIELATDREARGLRLDPQEAAFVAFHSDLIRRAEALIAEGEAKRAQEVPA